MSATPTSESTKPEQSKKPTHWWEAVGWIGTGLVVGTVLLTLLVLWRLMDERVGSPEPTHGVWQVPLAIALVVTLTVFRRDRRELNPDPVGPVTSTFFSLLGASLAILLLILLINLPAGSFVFTARLFDETYRVTPEEVALWTIPLVLLFGLVLLLVSHRWPRTASWRRWTVPFAVGMVLALLADPAMRALSEHVPTEHTFLAQAPDGPAPYPSSVSQPGWKWQAPDRAKVVEVERGPLGPVVVLSDGLVGLDGATGEELWSHRNPLGDVTAAVQAGADRAHMVLRSGDEGTGISADHEDLLRPGQVSVLDTSTGEIVEEFERSSTEPGAPVVQPVPGYTVHSGTSDTTVWVRVHEVSGGDPLWELEFGDREREETGTFCAPTDIYDLDEQRQEAGNILVRDDQLVFAYRCLEAGDFGALREALDLLEGGSDDRWTVHVVALDLRTGTEDWSREWAGESGSVEVRDGGPALDAGADPAVIVDGIRAHDGAPAPDTEADPDTVFEQAGESSDVLVLDAVDGSDVLDAFRVEGRFPQVLRADTGGAVVFTWEEDPGDQGVDARDHIFHRLDASGEVSGVIRLPAQARTGEHSLAEDARWSGLALADGVALPFLDSEEPEVGGVPSLVAARFQDTDPGPSGATRGANILAGTVQSWDRYGSSGNRWPQAVVVPGAVVSHVGNQSESVYGWQP